MSKARKKTAPRVVAQPPRNGAGGGRAALPLAPDWLIIGLAAVGMLITAYLSFLAWSGGPAALCTEGGGCDIVRQSRWSRFLGLPVAFWGFLVYALLALMAWRMPARLKRWRWMSTLALVGVAVSLYLQSVALIALDAVCPWCLASFAVISAIFGVLVARPHAAAPGMPWTHWWARGAGIAAVVLATLHFGYNGLPGRPDDARLSALADHLRASGAQYYGAWWCTSCQEQKRAFGAAGERLPFVECVPNGRGTPMLARCQTQGIKTFPTWIIGGSRHTGVLTPRELARHSGFDWR